MVSAETLRPERSDISCLRFRNPMRVLSTTPARIFIRVLAVIATVTAIAAPVSAGTRLKDILDVEGVRDNQLLGYGVVTGLNGSGDSLRNCAFTKQSLESMMERLGINTRNSRSEERRVGKECGSW